MTGPVPPSRVRFFLCDDVRAETDGKITLVGFYPDDKIIVNQLPAANTGPVLVAIPQLAIAAIVMDGVGTLLSPSGEVTDPLGKLVSRATLGAAVLVAGKTYSIVIKGNMFPVPHFGRYEFKLTLDKTTFSFPFDIQAGPTFTGVPLIPPAIAAAPTVPTGSQTPLREKARKKRRARKKGLK